MTQEQDHWTVDYSRKAEKQVEVLKKEHPKIYAQLLALTKEIRISGPWRKNWSHYGLLNGKDFPKDTLHCHIKSGKPTYVACWCIKNKQVKIVEVFYVGTHEKAPY